MLMAVTRQVSRSIGNCELTFLTRTPIDVDRARRQHEQYEAALKRLGLAVLSLPEAPDLPDSVFVEDTAVVLDECAVMMRCAASSRTPEIELMSGVLRPYRRVLQLEAPAHMDGGDILRVGRKLYVGLSKRTEAAAIEQLGSMLQPFGYSVQSVPVTECLHLKSAVTQVAQDTLLLNPRWVSSQAFGDVKTIETDASEPYGANALLVAGSVVYSTEFPKTAARLVAAGIHPVPVEADELAKAEGAVTCCSLVFSSLAP
jgi:dimethylargininase